MSSIRDATAEEIDLYARAEKARTNAYAVYSRFRVGAALHTTDDQYFTGVNFENASFGLTICAERGAVAGAVAAGVIRNAIKAGANRKAPQCVDLIAVAAAARSAPPCGACRQVLAQFATPRMRVVYRRTDKIKSIELDELLPENFEL